MFEITLRSVDQFEGVAGIKKRGLCMRRTRTGIWILNWEYKSLQAESEKIVHRS